MDLYIKHRPTTFKQVIGQDAAIAELSKAFKTDTVSHVTLLSGPSGCGKTTIARIMKNKLGCSDHDFIEINAAEDRGIEMARGIKQQIHLAPMNGPCRIWYLDEVHKATGECQTALLKSIEDVPSHVYFILATTEPRKLLKTILTRSSEVILKLLKIEHITALLSDIAAKENAKLSDEVINQIAEVAEGSARKAIVILQQVIGLESEEAQLEAIQATTSKRQAWDLLKALLYERSTWNEVAKIIAEIEEEPESFRRMVLAAASTELLKAKRTAKRAYLVITAFEGNWYDSGRAGLVRSCFEVLGNR